MNLSTAVKLAKIVLHYLVFYFAIFCVFLTLEFSSIWSIYAEIRKKNKLTTPFGPWD